MDFPRRFRWFTVLWRWLVLSLLIPTFAIFARWVVNYAFATGQESISLLEMLRESEVTFLAAVILAETLGCSDPLKLDNYDSSSRIGPRKGRYDVKATNVYTRLQGTGST